MKNIHHPEIYNELTELAPKLAEIPKKNLFDVPEKYFENVEEQILSQLYLVQFDKKLSIPVSYLEDVEKDLIKWAGNENQTKINNMPVLNFKIYKKWMYSAAAILVFGLAFLMVFNNQNEKMANPNFSAIDQDEYLQYIQDNIDEFEISSLIDHEILEEGDITGIDVGLNYDESEFSPNDASDINL
ncbi:MAG: hypothetical protein IPL55_02300 [Saprospiraceae bacterium]|jgi:hypothetical protein|nr:hypothetical protein [Saprospiraceae bacterium]MBL0024691.1 hypothetical protein [Saprospiraceae bacterium]